MTGDGDTPDREPPGRETPEADPVGEAAAGEAAPEEGRGLLGVRLGEARFGFWIDEVLEILETPPISRLPLVEPEVAGVTSVRGDVVPVLDLGLRLVGRPARRPGRLVLVRHEGSGSMVALLVDAVDTLAPVREADVREPPPAAEAQLPADYMTGVATIGDEVVTILHLGRAVAPPRPTTDEG